MCRFKTFYVLACSLVLASVVARTSAADDTANVLISAEPDSHVIGHKVEQISTDLGVPPFWHEGNQAVWGTKSGETILCTFNGKGECVAVTFTFNDPLTIKIIVGMIYNEFGHIEDFQHWKSEGELHFRDAAFDSAEYSYDDDSQKYLFILSRGDAKK